jgi:mRNA interferase MazF
VKPGGIHWVTFPPRGGREQTGLRPAIILQNATTTALVPTVLTIPLTSQLRSLRFPGTVFIETDDANGLRQNSVALVFQTTAVDSRHIGERIGSLSEANLAEVFASINDITHEPSQEETATPGR